MSALHAPALPAAEPASSPTPRERHLTWATIFLALVVFWYGFGVAVTTAWSSLAS